MANEKTISIIILALVAIIAVIGIVMVFRGGAAPGRAILAPTYTTPLSTSRVYTAPQQQSTVSEIAAPKTAPCKSWGPIGAICNSFLGLCCKQSLGQNPIVCSSQSGAGKCRVN